MRVPGTGSAPPFCSGKRKPRRSLEYLCVSRLRRRRLLAFLSRHGFNSTFEALVQESEVFFSVDRLLRLVRLGEWGDAMAYVSHFVPDVDLLGEDGSLFFNFLSIHKAIHSIAMRTPGAASMTQLYERELKDHPNPDPDLGAFKIIRLLSALHRCDQLRNSINWRLVRLTAVDIVRGLIGRTPEFNDLVRLPDCRDKPHDILPIRSCYRRRHHVKKTGRIPASGLAKLYLQKKKMGLLSLSRSEEKSLVPGLSSRAEALLAKFVGLSVGAGLNEVVQAQHSFEVPCNKVPKCKPESSASCNHSVVEVSVSAKHKQVRHPLEYPCVSRLRHRRLLAFFRWRNSGSTFNAFVQETDVFFSIEHLHRLVSLGQWDDAIKYVSRFVPSLDMLGSEGIVFFNFLLAHKALQSIAAGEPHGALTVEQYERNLKKNPNSDPGTVKLTRVLLTMLRCERLRASVDWSCMRFKAAEIAKDLITKAPEFNDLLRLPNFRDKPHNILPIGSCSHQRRHIKERERTPPSDIAKFYLQKKRSLPSPSHCEGNSLVSGLSCEESAWLADIIVESVQAGICRVIPHGPSFEGSSNEGLKHTVITGYSGRQVSFARNNPQKRPLTTVCQEFNPKRQHISGEFGQHAGSMFEVRQSQGNAGVVRPYA